MDSLKLCLSCGGGSRKSPPPPPPSHPIRHLNSSKLSAAFYSYPSSSSSSSDDSLEKVLSSVEGGRLDTPGYWRSHAGAVDPPPPLRRRQLLLPPPPSSSTCSSCSTSCCTISKKWHDTRIWFDIFFFNIWIQFSARFGSQQQRSRCFRHCSGETGERKAWKTISP